MSEIFNIKSCKDKGYVLIVNPEKALNLGLSKKYLGYVSFGIQKCYVDIKVSSEIQEDEIYLSKEAMDYLYLPGYPDFEVQVQNNEVVIGPHIGIFYQNKDDKITKNSLRSALRYVNQYSKLHGSIVIFALDKVDQSRRLIEGYCYNPKLKDWERGTFPYPLSIYMKVPMNRSWKNHFLSLIGDTMFNNYYLNKYQMYNWLSTDSSLVQYLPHTVLYESSQDVLDMLKRYTKVYVKPVAGFQGKGVVKISLEDGRTAIRYREDECNIEKYFENLSVSRECIERLFTYDKYPNQYIVQQPIDLMTYEGRVFDFRVVMIKDGYGKWICKVIVGRIGAFGSIVSNICSGGEAMPGIDLLKKVLNSSHEEAAAMEKKIESFAFRVCDILVDRGINCGNIGLDIGLDKSKHLWLIEINSRRPDPLIAMDINDRGLYRDLVSAPLLYGKFLAGFKP